MSSQCFKRSPGALFCDVGSDIVALNPEKGQCYGMEKVTAAVWTLLAEPSTIEQLCENLVGMYDVEPEVCRSDIEELISLFQKEGLIQEVIAAR